MTLSPPAPTIRSDICFMRSGSCRFPPTMDAPRVFIPTRGCQETDDNVLRAQHGRGGSAVREAVCILSVSFGCFRRGEETRSLGHGPLIPPAGPERKTPKKGVWVWGRWDEFRSLLERPMSTSVRSPSPAAVPKPPEHRGNRKGPGGRLKSVLRGTHRGTHLRGGLTSDQAHLRITAKLLGRSPRFARVLREETSTPHGVCSVKTSSAKTMRNADGLGDQRGFLRRTQAAPKGKSQEYA
jgi:hypothetical protein